MGLPESYYQKLSPCGSEWNAASDLDKSGEGNSVRASRRNTVQCVSGTVVQSIRMAIRELAENDIAASANPFSIAGDTTWTSLCWISAFLATRDRAARPCSPSPGESAPSSFASSCRGEL